MKALIYTAPAELTYQEVSAPVPADGDSLIRVDSVGICGSDMHAFLGHDDRRPAPLILGHEAAGVTDDGRRVTVNPLVVCGECRYCQSGRDNLCLKRQIISMPPREGAFAEFLAMPEENLISVPSDISLTKAALAEPIACGWHGVRLGRERLYREFEAAKILVIGGGAIGVGVGLSALAQGATDVTLVESNALRRAYLSSHTVLATVSAEGLSPQGDFDLVIDGVGYEATRRLASGQVCPGGVIVHIGLGSAEGGIDIRRLTLQEVMFIGTYTYTAQDFRDTAAAIFAGRLGGLDWIEERPLKDGHQAFLDIKAGQVAAPKIMLKP
jgi:L-iditol 2-dehydrogenase